MFVASILFSLQRWIDQRQRDRQVEIRRMQEQDEDDGSGDEPPEQYVVQMPVRAQAVVHYRCRVCGYGAEEPTFCPDCLADTLVRAD